MAHGDYNCCMICDRKMEYAAYDDATTKEGVCSFCLQNMRNFGKIIINQKELMDFLKSKTRTEALHWLIMMYYKPCFYDNDIDKYLIKRRLVTTKAKDGKWGKRLFKK